MTRATTDLISTRQTAKPPIIQTPNGPDMESRTDRRPVRDMFGNQPLYLWGAAQLLKVDVHEIRRLMHEDILPAYRDEHHRWRIRREVVDSYLKTKTDSMKAA